MLDGIDFAIEGGLANKDNWDVLARNLSSYNNNETSGDNNKKVYLSASPQCPFPDASLENALGTGLFDFVWIQFYNNPQCEFGNNGSMDLLENSWNKWIANSSNTSMVFLGLPASPDAVSYGGYISATNLTSQVLPAIKNTTKYGGVMLWSRYYDVKTNYSTSIINYV